MAWLVGLVCVDVAAESAACRLAAAWPAACTPPPPPAFCAAFWVVALVLPAADCAAEALLCDTAPELAPGLRMATWIAWLAGLVCVDVAVEAADWVLSAAWPTSW